ncbi:FadR/GntR family transcriptional regulator [Streptomyces shenzhenensis]|uniref:FadR/GntR family transcriptional regulator n=1 Tax=Streptomyces shenzhenensis TaxID=943815 RepID=UPI0037F66B75
MANESTPSVNTGSPFTPRPINTRSAAEQIAEQLRDSIATGAWAPGDRLPAEWEMAERYGVSRGTVREAMRLLAAHGLVTSTRGATGGTFVGVPRGDALAGRFGDFIVLGLRAGDLSAAEVYHARRILERECVRLAALNRTAEDLEVIAAPIERVRAGEALSMEQWLEEDVAFHTAVAGAAKNGILQLAMTAVHAVRPRTNTLLRAKLEKAPIWEQHQSMFEAIRDGDPVAAVKALEAHVDYLDSIRDPDAG